MVSRQMNKLLDNDNIVQYRVFYSLFMRLIVRIGRVDNDIASPDDLMRYDLDHLVGNFSHYPLDVADRSNDNVVENHSEPKLHR